MVRNQSIHEKLLIKLTDKLFDRLLDTDMDGLLVSISTFQVRDDDVVLEIECGTNNALMYLSRLCQGSKGPCIWFQEAWITPNEFQYISGYIRRNSLKISLFYIIGISKFYNEYRLNLRILYCDAETIMRRYNNVKVSQCVLFDQEKTIGNCFPSR